MPLEYMLPVFVRHTTAAAANSLVWAMRNLGTRSLYLTRVSLVASFSGTAAASHSRAALLRFRSATPTGGTAMTVVKMNTADGASAVTDARFLDTGLTVTGVTFDTSFLDLSCQRQVSASGVYSWSDADRLDGLRATRGKMIIAPNDGLGLRLVNAAVIGDCYAGGIAWVEQ